MNYAQSVEYIHSLLKFGIKPGLERITALCGELGNPQDNLKIIHVAGTNGKGSISTMLSEVLKQTGYKVGLFTSPYVLDFRERMQINGEMIDKNELAQIVNKIKPIVESLEKNGLQLTEFEVITAAAFYFFMKNKCDIVVLEVGLGGRFDSTNIIKNPLVSVITSISYDHINVLGSTISEIAFEKCGIIKDYGITVSYPQQHTDAKKVIEETAKEKNNRLIIPNLSDISVIESDITGSKAVIDKIELEIPFAGKHMVLNCSVAVAALGALNELEFKVTDENIKDGIKGAKIPARMEVLTDNPTVIILDGGHNGECARALDAFIKEYLKNKKIVGLIGMMADKDYHSYIKTVAPNFNKVIATTPDNPRALDAKTLCEVVEKHCIDCDFCLKPEEAVKYIKSILSEYDALVICGSFYLSAEVRNSFLS
ncbi:MAG TPA: folylpolyglutamate synthase/dihydrofolate synthase family protein [Clostridia bacterium]|nr:folylpolyglutamate synthase/dihydrofolate synthase family protein [Clostridia bacterium]